jgi:hypothetical protein
VFSVLGVYCGTNLLEALAKSRMRIASSLITLEIWGFFYDSICVISALAKPLDLFPQRLKCNAFICSNLVIGNARIS